MQKQKKIEELNPWSYRYVYPRSSHTLLPHQQLATILYRQELLRKLLKYFSILKHYTYLYFLRLLVSF